MSAREETWGELGAAMRALPNDRWRAACEYFVADPKRNGAQVRAARRSGFGSPNSTPLNMARYSSRIFRDERMIAAVEEEMRKVRRLVAPDAARH